MDPRPNEPPASARWSVPLAALAVFLGAYLGFRGEPILIQFQGSQLVKSAHAFNEGHGLQVDPGKPLAKFPPLYALLLAPLERLGWTVNSAAYLLNAAFLGLSFAGLAALARSLGLASIALPLVAWGLLAPNVYLLRSVRPDFIPICMSMITLACLVRYAEGGGNRALSGALMGAAVSSSIATLGRYMALFTLLPVAFAAVWWWAPRGARRLRDAAVYTAVAAAPVVAWMIRNVHQTGYATGMSRLEERGVRSVRLSLSDNIENIVGAFVLDGFSYVSLGVRLPGEHAHRAGATLAVVGTVAACALYFGALARARGATGLPASGSTRGARATLLARAYVAWYLAALVLLWTVGNNDPINTRYVAPVYPFVLLLVCRSWSRLRAAGARGPARAVLAALALALVPNAVKSVQLAGRAPGEQLTELRVWDTRPASWRHGIEWDDTRRLNHPLDQYGPVED